MAFFEAVLRKVEVKVHVLKIVSGLIVVTAAINLIAYYYDHNSAYYLRPTDIQEDYFYGSLRVLSGAPLARALHPGVPIYYLMAATQSLFADPIKSASSIFLASYSLLNLILVASLTLFARAAPKGATVWALIAVAVLLAWPPTLFYSLTYGADAFVLPLTAVIIAVAWRGLERDDGRRDLWRWPLLGALSGAAIAVKLTLIMPVAAIFMALALRVVLTRTRQTLYTLLLFGGCASAAFLVLMVPVLWNISAYVRMIVKPPDYLAVPLTPGARISLLFANLAKENAIVAWGFGLCFLVAFVGAGTAAWAASTSPDRRSERLPKLTLFAVLLLGFYQSLATLSADGNPGVVLRNCSAAICVIPLGMFLLAESAPVKMRADWLPLHLLLSVILIASALFATTERRVAYDRDRVEMQGFWSAAIGKLAGPGKAVAISEGANQEAFHFYGDEVYGGRMFEADLTAKFPRFVYVRRIEVDPASRTPTGVPTTLSATRAGVKSHWYSVFRPVEIKLSNEPLGPVAANRSLSGIVMRENDLPRGCDLNCYVDVLRHAGYKVSKAETEKHSLGNLVVIAMK